MFKQSTNRIATDPRAELLLACARTVLDAQTVDQIRTLVKGPIDWNDLLLSAVYHRVAPLLYRSLKSACPEQIEPTVFTGLHEHFQASAHQSLFQTGELCKLLRLLEAHEIPAIPFKGPILGATVYRNLALRPFDDLDILIHRQDFFRAKELLISQGYLPSLEMTAAQEAAYIRKRHEYKFGRFDDKVFVELQWCVTKRSFSFDLDFERLWERCSTVAFAGMSVLAFRAEDLLLILCVHGSKHLWQRLIWICDVAELIRVNQQLDWERVIDQARAYGAERMLWLGLLLANRLLGAVVPEAVARRMQADTMAQALAEQVRSGLFRTTGATGRQIGNQEIFYLRMRERLRDRARLLFYLYPLLLKPIHPLIVRSPIRIRERPAE